MVYHKDFVSKNTFDKMYSVGRIGVDSAMAGIFDYESIPSVDEYDDFINECYKARDSIVINNSGLGGKVLNGKGAISESGYGDGVYDVKVLEDDGKVKGIFISFIND